jgi:hypothetical protein
VLHVRFSLKAFMRCNGLSIPRDSRLRLSSERESWRKAQPWMKCFLLIHVPLYPYSSQRALVRLALSDTPGKWFCAAARQCQFFSFV